MDNMENILMNRLTDNLLCKHYDDSTNNSHMYSEINTNMESEALKITITCYWTLAMIISLIGNVSTCAIICRDRALRTTTNCYLFHLALIDLMIALLIPNEIYLLWTEKFYPFKFNICRLLFLYFLTNLSVLTITSLTIERYLAIAKPFPRRNLVSKYRVLKVITGLWIGTGCCHAVALTKIYTSETHKILEDICEMKITPFKTIMIAIELTFFFLIPLFIILILYVSIVIKMKSTKFNVRNSTSSLNKNKAVTVLGAVVGIFFFCWSPSFAFRIIMLFAPPLAPIKNFDIMRKLHFFCAAAVYTSIAINPILYYTMSSRFRKSYKDLLGSHPRVESIELVNETQVKK